MKLRFAPLPSFAALCVIALTMALGWWQLQRGYAKQSAHTHRIAMQQQAATALTDLTGTVQEGQSVTVRGQFISDNNILLENRPHISGQDARSGFVWLSPFKLEVAGRLSPQVLWVARGWVARNPQNRLPPIGLQTPSGVQNLQGVLVKAPSRVMQLGDGAATVVKDPKTAERFEIRQNIDLAQYSQAQQWAIYPLVLQEHGSNAEGVERNWALPGEGADKHFGYAFQWFGIAAMTLILSLVLAYRAARSPAAEPTAKSVAKSS